MPHALVPGEYYRRLELGLATLRDECLSRNSADYDPEVGARFAQLFALWLWGYPLEPERDDKLRRYRLGDIARLCAGLLSRVACDKPDEVYH